MDVIEASECARIIKAKHSIPIHFSPNGFVEEKAQAFDADKKIIIRPNDILKLV